MKKIMEVLNVAIGFELVAIGLVYLSKLDISSAASWGIFGCMYMVMDKYSVMKNMSTGRSIVEKTKFGAAWLGFTISTAFLGYVLYTI